MVGDKYITNNEHRYTLVLGLLSIAVVFIFIDMSFNKTQLIVFKLNIYGITQKKSQNKCGKQHTNRYLNLKQQYCVINCFKIKT